MSNKVIKIEGHSDIVKDVATNAIISNDRVAFNNWKSKKLKEKEREDRICTLENKLSNIENLLMQLLANKNGS